MCTRERYATVKPHSHKRRRKSSPRPGESSCWLAGFHLQQLGCAQEHQALCQAPIHHCWGGGACCSFTLRVMHFQTSCNIMCELQSRIFRGLLQPLIAVTAIATAIATWETLREVIRNQIWHSARHCCRQPVLLASCTAATLAWLWTFLSSRHSLCLRHSFVVYLAFGAGYQLQCHLQLCAFLCVSTEQTAEPYALHCCRLTVTGSHTFPMFAADRLFAGKCSRVEHRDQCSLQPYQLCFVAAAGVQNQHLILTMGRGSFHLGRGHQPIPRYCTPGLIPGCA